jgi:NAD(P)-dependent dehydrogenase (short-subunit alcohol dehydrogenase family)
MAGTPQTAPRAVLDGRVAIVTGGGTGIGRATALAFADAGARVLVTGRRVAPLDAVAAAREGIEAHVADVSDPETAAGTVAAAVDRWGRLDVLVNNAAVLEPAPLEQADADRVARILAINVVGPTMLARAALPHLERERGSIVNVSSTVAQRPAPRIAHYGASKAALDYLTRTWALELARHGIRVNGVAPGPTESDALAAAGLGAEAIDRIKKQEAEKTPFGRRGEPEEIAHWLLALADPAATWITGQVISVDGGYTLT